MSAAQRRVRAAYTAIEAAGRPEVWITLRLEDDVLAEARRIDTRVAAGERLPLAGLVAAVKDNIDVAGLPTTAGAPSYSYRPDADATSVARLRAAGAIVLGKTNMDQFATGLVGTRSPYGAVRNAWDPARISGGSSSGSAVAVALGLADIALGTDTAGSGRVPAALNGIVGIKPTRGLIPATGVVPACRTLDCVTVFARSLDLAEQAVRLMSGPDAPNGAATATAPECPAGGGPRLAVPLPEQVDGMDDGWAEAFGSAVDRFRAAGAEIVPVDISPLLEAATLLYGGAFVAERYAAVGAHIEAHSDLIGTGLDPVVARIILDGAKPTAADYFADRERLDLLGARAAALLSGLDALLTPTTTGHPTLEEVSSDPVGVNSRLGRYTNFANLLDLAAVAVPGGTGNHGAFGIMLTGAAGSDARLARLAALYESSPVDLLAGDNRAMTEAADQRRPGRPRLRPAASDGLSAREEILDAAAALFVSQGLAATTTRQIAERVGIRQASLYYYFGGKDEILLELLTRSVRPSLSAARRLESVSRDDPAAGLYALALTDVATLVAAPHNIGILYLSPEVRGESFAPFRAERALLQDAYGRLGVAAGCPLDRPLAAVLLMQLVESVIQLRRTDSLRDGYAHSIAEACLRLAGRTDPDVSRARAAARKFPRES